MRRSLTSSLILLGLASLPHSLSAQSGFEGQPASIGGRELGLFFSGRVLSTEYSAEEGKSALGGEITFARHLSTVFAVQGGLAVNYSRQGYSYYRPPLMIYTPTVSLLVQLPTASTIQPYGLVGAGYEFIRYTHPRCDCDQSRSMGVGNLGIGVRKLMSSRRAVRFEVSSQVGKGGPAFTALAGASFFLGRDQFAKQRRMARPDKVKTEPPVPRPVQRSTVTSSTRPATTPVTKPPASVITTPPPARAPAPSPLPGGIGAVLLQANGTQVDFTRPTWRDDIEPMLDGLVVDLTSDSGESIKLSIEAHTDNVGSNAANIMLGLDRARAVRDYLVSQGVAPNRIRISSAGEDAPIAPNTTAIGRQQNRRIVIKRDN